MSPSSVVVALLSLPLLSSAFPTPDLMQAENCLAASLRRNSSLSKSFQLQYQDLECWADHGYSGISRLLTGPTPNMEEIGFDNMASSCRFQGIWILYGDANYNRSPDGHLNVDAPVSYSWGSEWCEELDDDIDDEASSARFAGTPEGFKFDTVHLYEGENFIGQDRLVTSDQSSLAIPVNSVIVTGISPWTLYERPNFEGESLCVVPVGDIDITPGFFATSDDLGPLAGRISSVRRRCLSENVVRVKPFKRDSSYPTRIH